jgi:predicted alpha/beta-fold hydrolase
MTIVPALWRRKFPLVKNSGVKRQFEVEPGAKVLTACHWQVNKFESPTLIAIHGLEGSIESQYVMGVSEKALASGFNVVRMNMRNCGDSLHLSETLYHSGLSGDVIAVVKELKEADQLNNIFIAGFSMGGNLALKAASELEEEARGYLQGVCAVSPSIDLPSCMKELERGFNKLYEKRFLRRLKKKVKKKNKLMPGLLDVKSLRKIKGMRDFDNTYTAPFGGFENAENYYIQASSLPFVDLIRVPTLIITAQDDPFIPYRSFLSPKLKTPYITLLAPPHGGHVGFLGKQHEEPPIFDRFWAENRVIQFCSKHSEAGS